MFSYLVELWCDKPKCTNRICRNPTLHPLDEKDVLTQWARADGWTLTENEALCPGCTLEKLAAAQPG